MSTNRWQYRLILLVATCGGAGYSPFFPGTVGALWGIPIYLAIALGIASPWLQTLSLGMALILSCVVTVVLGDWAEKHFNKKDSGSFVTDEVAGFLGTVILFPGPLLAVMPDPWLVVLWAFPLTRIIDILKVPPARQLEHLPSGWGVLADDLMGSVYTAALLHGLYYFLPWCFWWPQGA